MFLMNEFTNQYWIIIELAQMREISKTEYYEKHHILPKSMGGDNSKENLVKLTGKEHFLVHKLLPNMTTGRDKAKMCKAFAKMCFTSNNRKYEPTSEEYEAAKILAAYGTSLQMKDWWSKVTPEKIAVRTAKYLLKLDRKEASRKTTEWSATHPEEIKSARKKAIANTDWKKAGETQRAGYENNPERKIGCSERAKKWWDIATQDQLTSLEESRKLWRDTHPEEMKKLSEKRVNNIDWEARNKTHSNTITGNRLMYDPLTTEKAKWIKECDVDIKIKKGWIFGYRKQRGIYDYT